MERSQIRKMVDDFLNDLRTPLEKALQDGRVKPSEINEVLDSLQNEGGPEATGRKIAKVAMEDSSTKADEDLESIGADIARMANGE